MHRQKKYYPMRFKYVVMTALLWSAICISSTVAETTSSSEINSFSEIFSKFLELIISVPGIIFILLIFFRKPIERLINSISTNGGEAKVGEIVSVKINEAIQELEEDLDSQKEKIETQQKTIDDQQEIINKLVVYSMSSYIFEHLKSLYYKKRSVIAEEFIYKHHTNMKSEMCYLRDNGFIKKSDNTYLEFNEELNNENLMQIIELTDVGNWYVDLRMRE